MADKAFIDTLVRLSTLYTEASKDLFPIKPHAYPQVTKEQLDEYGQVYGLDAYCNFPTDQQDIKDKYKAVYRLHQVWEQALLRRLGENKNVNGSRIFMLFIDQSDWESDNYQCIYPAEKMTDDLLFSP